MKFIINHEVKPDKEGPISVTGEDFVSANQGYMLEDYENYMDELMIEAEDVSKVYRDFSNIHISSIISDYNRSFIPRGLPIHFVSELVRMGYNLNNINVDLLRQFLEYENYIPTAKEAEENPELIKNLAKLRLAYYTDMMNVFKRVIDINKEAIELNESQAENILNALESDNNIDRKAGISALKMKIKSNIHKFKRDYGYDLTELGGGKIFIQLKDLGALRTRNTLERLIQHGLTHDAVILSHGSGSKEKDLMDTYKEIDDILTYIDKFNHLNDTPDDLFEIYNLITSCSHLLQHINNNTELTYALKAELFRQFNEKIMPKFEKMRIKIMKMVDKAKDRKIWYMFNKFDSDLAKTEKVLHNKPTGKYTWIMMPIKLDDGKIYIDMIEALNYLIKTGRKKIFILSCNPGHVELSKLKELEQRDDVTIQYSLSSIMADNVNDVDVEFGNTLNESIFNKKDVLSLVRRGSINISKIFKNIKDDLVKFIIRISRLLRKLNGLPPQARIYAMYIDVNGNLHRVENTPKAAIEVQLRNLNEVAKRASEVDKQQSKMFKLFTDYIDSLSDVFDAMLQDNAYILEAAKILEMSLASLSAEFVDSDEDESSDEYRRNIDRK